MSYHGFVNRNRHSFQLWGGIYHRMHRSKKLILLLCVITAVLSLLLMSVGKFWIFLLLYILVFFFENPIFPLIDSTIMEAEYPFGTARKWGAVGFALGIGVAGAVADPFGLQSVFPMFAIFFLLTALLIWISLKGKKGLVSMDDPPPLHPKHPDSEEGLGKPKTKGGYKDLFHNGKYVALLLSSFFFIGPTFAHNTYFSFLYIGAGGTIAGMGLVLLLMVISEAPFMAWSRISSARPWRELFYWLCLFPLCAFSGTVQVPRPNCWRQFFSCRESPTASGS